MTATSSTMCSLDSGKNSSIAITGASRGIGLAIARSLREQSLNLALIASSIESLDPIRSEFPATTKFYGADFSSSGALRELATKLRNEHPAIDVLVNNCGVYLEGPFTSCQLPDLDKVIDVNIKAPIALTRMLLEQLCAGSSSIVINMSSISAKYPLENQAIYGASKAALTMFSNILRKELNPLGIRVSVIQPTGVNTWGAEDNTGLLSPSDLGTIVKQIIQQNPKCQIDEITLSSL